MRHLTWDEDDEDSVVDPGKDDMSRSDHVHAEVGAEDLGLGDVIKTRRLMYYWCLL